MMPSNQCSENVKLRHRNPVTATSTVGLAVGDELASNNNSTLSKENPSQEKRFESCFSKHFGFFSELSANKCERYMTHRSQTLSESSDVSQINEVETFDDCCENLKQTLRTSSATMRAGDFQRQPSISQIKNSTLPKPRCNGSRAFSLFLEIAIRLVLLASFMTMERMTPFKRIIHPEEVWLYKNPISKEYVSAAAIIIAVIFAPLVLNIISYFLSRDKKDFLQANYAYTLGVVLTGFMTSLIKISVGRPRPDFYYRCYPDGVMLNNNFDHCTGDPRQVNEGRKSFPSGHSSMAFASFGFMAFYLASKLHIFNERGRGRSWRLCVSIAPLVVAAEVAISRTCDYRHHWQDVVVGSLLGICISYLCYRQYFPSIFARNCHRSYSRDTRITTNQVNCVLAPNDATEDGDENEPLIAGEKDNKWI